MPVLGMFGNAMRTAPRRALTPEEEAALQQRAPAPGAAVAQINRPRSARPLIGGQMMLPQQQQPQAKQPSMWDDISQDPLAFLLTGTDGIAERKKAQAAQAASLAEKQRWDGMLGQMNLSPQERAMWEANPAEFAKSLSQNYQPQTGTFYDPRSGKWNAKPQDLMNVAEGTDIFDPNTRAPVYSNAPAPKPPTYDYLAGTDGYHAVNKSDPNDVRKMGFAPPVRNGITMTTDANGRPVVNIGGPAKDGTQLTGPTPPEKSYYKDVNAYEAAKQQRDVLLNNLDEAEKLVNGWTTGVGGAFTSMIPGSQAVDLQQRIGTVQALIGFDALQQMRNNSPTGGALGAITEKELSFLQSVQGSLATIQSEAQLRQVMKEIRASVQRLAAAQDQAFQAQYQALEPGQNRGQPRVSPGGGVTMYEGMSNDDLQRRIAELEGRQ